MSEGITELNRLKLNLALALEIFLYRKCQMKSQICLLRSIKCHNVLLEVHASASIIIKHAEKSISKKLSIVSQNFLQKNMKVRFENTKKKLKYLRQLNKLFFQHFSSRTFLDEAGVLSSDCIAT